MTPKEKPGRVDGKKRKYGVPPEHNHPCMLDLLFLLWNNGILSLLVPLLDNIHST